MRTTRWTWARTLIPTLALVFVALSLVPAGAHLFELPNKMALSAEAYMTVQQIYRGWALFAFAIFPALVLTLANAALARADLRAFILSLLAFLCIGIDQIVFWTYVYPANRLTENWTRLPADLESVRRQWEYGHATGALLTFLAFVLLIVSVRMIDRRRG